MSTERKIPVAQDRHQSFVMTIDKLVHDWKGRDSSDYSWSSGLIMGQPLPDFQRPLCWSDDQNVSFIESIWLGFDIGHYMVAKYKMESDELVKYSDCLIDGQQRLNAIQLYLSDAFSVYELLWSELTSLDQRLFRNTVFPVKIIDSLDEGYLRDTYNRLNFAGVPHDASEKA